jgi:hypothetical protein
MRLEAANQSHEAEALKLGAVATQYCLDGTILTLTWRHLNGSKAARDELAPVIGNHQPGTAG